MKQILFFFVFIFLIGCAEEHSHDNGADSLAQSDSLPLAFTHPDSVAARKDSVTLTADTVVPVDNKIHASFRFYYTTSYCGGARPTEEIIQENAMPRLLTNSKVKLKNHHTDIVYTCVIGSDGEANVDLEEGKYDVYFTKEINPALPTGYDPKCSLWQNKSLFTVKVTNDGKTREVTLHFECNPCDENMKRRP